MSEQEATEDEFFGFHPPVNNYFRMPHEWIDICAKIDNLAELKVIQYVLRHTWGYQEYDDTKPKVITTDEFMHGRKRRDGSRIDKGTGLSNKSVVEGLKRAVKHGYLKCEVDDTDKARISKAYALKMFKDESDVKKLHIGNSYVEPTQQLCTSSIAPMKKLHSRDERSTYRTEKETKETHLKKDTQERHRSATSSKEIETGFYRQDRKLAALQGERKQEGVESHATHW